MIGRWGIYIHAPAELADVLRDSGLVLVHILEEGPGRELGAKKQRAPAVDHHAQADVAAFFSSTT